MNKLLYPETEEIQKRIEYLRKTDNTYLIPIENEKLTKLQQRYGNRGSSIKTIFSLFQMLVLVSWAGIVQRFSFHLEDYPEMLTGGFLWFKDLTMTDPYFVLPFINCIFMYLSFYMNVHQYNQISLLKMRRIFFIVPMLSFPVMTSLESGLMIYLCTTTIVQAIIVYCLNSHRARKMLKIPQYLPGSKLEKMVIVVIT